MENVLSVSSAVYMSKVYTYPGWFLLVLKDITNGETFDGVVFRIILLK